MKINTPIDGKRRLLFENLVNGSRDPLTSFKDSLGIREQMTGCRKHTDLDLDYCKVDTKMPLLSAAVGCTECSTKNSTLSFRQFPTNPEWKKKWVINVNRLDQESTCFVFQALRERLLYRPYSF